jgi:hypothetical protein
MNTAVRAKLKGKLLKIELPLQKPKVSGSGKNKVVATTRGQMNTGIRHKGGDIVLVANAYIRNLENKRKKKVRRSRSKHDPRH